MDLSLSQMHSGVEDAALNRDAHMNRLIIDLPEHLSTLIWQNRLKHSILTSTTARNFTSRAADLRPLAG